MVLSEVRKLLQQTSTRVLLLVLIGANLLVAWNLPLPGTQQGSRLEAMDILSLYAAMPEVPSQALGELNQQAELLQSAAWSDADVSLLTEDVYQELGLFSYVTERVEPVANYDSILQEIDDNADILLKTGRFGSDTFGYRNIIESQKVFRELWGVKPQYFYSGAVELLPGGRITDLLLVLLCLLVGLELICTERTVRTMELVKPTYRGQLPLMLAKIVAGLLVTALGVLALYAGNLLVGVIRCGLFPLDAPVQSVFGFVHSPWKISVGGYIGAFYGMKCLWAACLLALVYGACGLGKSAVKSCCVFLLMLAPSFMFQDSEISLLACADMAELLAQYRNLNLMGYPVSQFAVCVFVMAATVLVGFGLAILTHIKSGTVQAKPVSKIFDNRQVSTNLLLHEAKKILIHQGALWVILGLIAVQFISYHDLKVHITLDEHRYMRYSEVLEGAASAEKDAYITKEEARFASLYEQLVAYAEDYASDRISKEEYDMLRGSIMLQLESEEVFTRAKNQYNQMKALGCDYVCQTPYEHLLGWKGQQAGLLLLIKLIVTLILGIAPIYAVEVETGMENLLNTVPRKQDSQKRKRMVASFYAVCAALIAFVPQVLHVRSSYGLPGLFSDAKSVPLLQIPAPTVLGGLLVYGAVMVCAATVMAQIIAVISKKTGSTVTTILLSSMLLLPVLFLLLW